MEVEGMEKYLPPSWPVREIANRIAMRVGVAPTIEVRTRRSGGTQRVPLQVLEHEGDEYLVSARGQSDWVRNLRAAGDCVVHQKGRRRELRAEEIDVQDRPPLLAAYQKKWESDVKKMFERLPDPVDHPVFRLRER